MSLSPVWLAFVVALVMMVVVAKPWRLVTGGGLSALPHHADRPGGPVAPRTFNIRQGMTAGVVMSIFFTISAILQSPPDSRVTAFLLTASSCAFFLGVVFLVARALQARPR